VDNSEQSILKSEPSYMEDDQKQKLGVNHRTGQSHLSINSNYRAYNLKDFKSLQDQQMHIKLGGLGPNIGSEDWERA